MGERRSQVLEKQLNVALRKTLEAISKKSFGPVSALGPGFNSSEYLSMRVEDPVNSRGGLNLGPAFLSRWVLAGNLEPKSCF